jgi:hypothetical protein
VGCVVFFDLSFILLVTFDKEFKIFHPSLAHFTNGAKEDI